MRDYPSLINCCTIDWFHGWPDDALLAIANRFLADEKLNETDRATAIDMLIEFQSTAAELADKHFARKRNRIFIPPVVYIDAINTFKKQLQLKKV